MKQTDPSTVPARRASLLSPAVAALALVTLGSLAGCAYTQTMHERNAEGERLRGELEYEQQRNRELSR